MRRCSMQGHERLKNRPVRPSHGHNAARTLVELIVVLLLISGLIVATRTCGPFGISWRLSYELWSAPCSATVGGRVDLWLIKRRSLLVGVERRFHIDRRAVAGVIAYEALNDVHLSNFFGLTRSSGPGKVHYKERYISEGLPAAKQVELRGMVPLRTITERRLLLSTDKGAMTYIAAIMSALADDASNAGYRVRCNPAILSTLYTAWSPVSAYKLFEARVSPEPLQDNAAGRWVLAHLGEIESDVGVPSARVCRKPLWTP